MHAFDDLYFVTLALTDDLRRRGLVAEVSLLIRTARGTMSIDDAERLGLFPGPTSRRPFAGYCVSVYRPGTPPTPDVDLERAPRG